MWHPVVGSWGWMAGQLLIAVVEMGLTLVLVLVGIGVLMDLTRRRVPAAGEATDAYRFQPERNLLMSKQTVPARQADIRGDR